MRSKSSDDINLSTTSDYGASPTHMSIQLIISWTVVQLLFPICEGTWNLFKHANMDGKLVSLVLVV